jgi:hypothetical protein
VSAILGFVTLVILLLAGIWGLQAGGGVSQAVILIISSIAAFGVWRAQQSATREQELRAKLVTDKKVLYKLYLDIVEELFDKAGPKPVNAQAVASTLKRLNTFVFGSLLIASDEVIIPHDRFLRASKVLDPATKQPDEKLVIPAVADVLLAMRRDAGETTALRPIDLMATFVRDVENMSSSFDRWAAEKSKTWPGPAKR